MKSCIQEIKRMPIVSWIWRRVRLRRICMHHGKVSAICDAQIRRYANGDLTRYQFVPKQNLGTERIVWQYWDSQGRNVPEIVQICLDSVTHYASDYQIIRLSDSNWMQYVDLPDFILRNEISKAHFTDVLRLALLVAYGGVWLDATVFLTGPLPEMGLELPYFMFTRDPNEEHKDYWENTWAYYFGWHKDFKVRVLNSVIFSKSGSKPLMILLDLLVNYWRDHEALPDYLFFQVLFNQAVENGLVERIPVISDCIPHFLQQLINTGTFYKSIEEILLSTHIHKLSYKCEDSADRLRSYLPIDKVLVGKSGYDVRKNCEI